MSSAKKNLRQKYSLSFFATTLLIALTTESSLAFSIKPIPFLTEGATETWDLDESYNLANPQRRGTTTLNPRRVRPITRGGTSGFLSTLRGTYPGWTFSSASRDLSGSFEIKEYNAVGTRQEVGAIFRLMYTPGAGDPTPQGNSLHWIQRVVSNHTITNNDIHGKQEDVIDGSFGSLGPSPYYDTLGSQQPFDERTFEDSPARIDVDKNHNWLAELYLVEQTAPQQVRIYNGIQWGWQNRVQPVPEPLTIFAAGVSLGFGALFKKTVQGTGQKKQKLSKR